MRSATTSVCSLDSQVPIGKVTTFDASSLAPVKSESLTRKVLFLDKSVNASMVYG